MAFDDLASMAAAFWSAGDSKVVRTALFVACAATFAVAFVVFSPWSYSLPMAYGRHKEIIWLESWEAI